MIRLLQHPNLTTQAAHEPRATVCSLMQPLTCGSPHAGAGGRYQLQEPLFALHKILFQLLDSPSLAVDALQRTAAAARKAGRLTHAMGAIHELRAIVQYGKQRCALTCVRRTKSLQQWDLLPLSSRHASARAWGGMTTRL